jgi:predicted Zn-dependent protease
MAMFDQKTALGICQQAIEKLSGKQAEALLYVLDKKLTRFANSTIHQNVAERNALLQLKVVDQGRIGTAVTNRLDEEGISQVAAQALDIATQAAEDPEFAGFAEPAEVVDLDSVDPDTAEQSPDVRAEAIRAVCEIAIAEDCQAFGAYSISHKSSAMLNSNGFSAYQAGTTADFQIVVRQNGSSGWAQNSSWRASDLDVNSLGQEALGKALRGVDARLIDPGEYTVVLDPYATQDLLTMLDIHGMGAQPYLDRRSWMNDRVGESVMSDKVHIWDDPLRLDFPPSPFDDEGTPKRRTEIVTAGVIEGPVHDRRTAMKANVSSTGHALPPFVAPWARSYGPLALHLVMKEGEDATDELIRSTNKGLYITRFWYTRLVHPRDCVITGMTRDGVTMIKDGELTFPVKDLRFTQSYVDALANVHAVGSETRTLLEFENLMATRAPALKIDKFRFTGSTV